MTVSNCKFILEGSIEFNSEEELDTYIKENKDKYKLDSKEDFRFSNDIKFCYRFYFASYGIVYS